MSFDVETLILKVFKEFSSSAKKTEELKSCFEFCEQEYQNVLRHVVTRWLSLFTALDRLIKCWPSIKTYFISQGKKECETIIWKFIKDQADEISDTSTLPEYFFVFYSFAFIFFSKANFKIRKKQN